MIPWDYVSQDHSFQNYDAIFNNIEINAIPISVLERYTIVQQGIIKHHRHLTN